MKRMPQGSSAGDVRTCRDWQRENRPH